MKAIDVFNFKTSVIKIYKAVVQHLSHHLISCQYDNIGPMGIIAYMKNKQLEQSYGYTSMLVKWYIQYCC